MARIPPLSGTDVVAILQSHGFVYVRHKGSHAVLQSLQNDTTVTVIVPLHKELATGTLRSIIRQSGLPRETFTKAP
ncbi:MAG: type II toxin-antitoxin system HicA family toxin [Ignavibacteria bacterium]|nr:type II toxin-antitoxin system HicA family toxin [Ignavibacteria bacterium]MBP6510314.1 type II toxin-antitoxin system HicA family toxin [Candidatus Kapabacteria bacterium]MBK6419647.1 type II toxin-antitoxin system HicA family toxin [Ignavibacteria bacterium]MBK6759723.1 type II toxin-antitoxin system HicA family toxin [Ignavibacteria bacterium]MBK7033087.1 type II toxin-antitoxin system HicA family toxin [Ignavibacteria bacterium]